MAKKLIFAIGEDTKYFFQRLKTESKILYIPTEKCDTEIDTNLFFDVPGDVWAGIAIFENYRKQIKNSTNKYDEFIIVTQSFSQTISGFIHSLAKYLKRKHIKLTVILNGNYLSKFFLSEIKKYAVVIDVKADKEYCEYFSNHFPKVSILELDGLINTIFLRELKKCA